MVGGAFHGDIAGAEEVGGAVAHFELKLGVAAEGGKVVRGKGMPQYIRLPVGKAGGAVQPRPMPPPIRRTDALVVCFLVFYYAVHK